MEDLVRHEGVRIERIVSTGQASPPEEWYDQNENEWVLLLSGAARLEINDDGDRTLVVLKPGDHYLLPARLKHRVDWTSPDEPTVWLAVWWSGEEKDKRKKIKVQSEIKDIDRSTYPNNCSV